MTADVPILWLASWYPNKMDSFTGNFIQRHARAVASGKKVHVIFLRRDLSLAPGTLQVESRTNGMLTEEICLYNSPGNRKLIKTFLLKQGRPALVHVHVALRAGLMALWLKKKYGIPFVVTEHWSGYKRHVETSIWKQGRVARLAASAIFRNAELVMPVSADLGKHIALLERGVNLQVVNNVVDTSIFSFRAKNTGQPYTFLHVSSLDGPKNPEFLLKAFQILNLHTNWRLVVVGPDTSALRQLGLQLGIDDRVEWCGELSNEDVAKAMQLADCFVLSSLHENSPCVIGEALCCGVPVVSTNVGGIPELVSSKEGILFDSQDLPAFQDAILQMYRQTKQWNREELALASAARFSYPVIAGIIEKNYANALANAWKP
jgi:glycosyltransferase involved in cell wall biosynthesis